MLAAVAVAIQLEFNQAKTREISRRHSAVLTKCGLKTDFKDAYECRSVPSTNRPQQDRLRQLS
jgi:hypothetical protein